MYVSYLDINNETIQIWSGITGAYLQSRSKQNKIYPIGLECAKEDHERTKSSISSSKDRTNI